MIIYAKNKDIITPWNICTHDSFVFIIITFNLSIRKTLNVVTLYKAPIKCDKNVSFPMNLCFLHILSKFYIEELWSCATTFIANFNVDTMNISPQSKKNSNIICNII